MKALVFQLLESTSLSSDWFQIPTCNESPYNEEGSPGGEPVTEQVPMELTLPQFYAFLHELEKAKATLDSA